MGSVFLLFTVLALPAAPGSRALAKTLVISTFEQDTVAVKVNLMLQRAYKKLGIDMKLIRFPASRALAEANAGITVDGELIRIANLSKRYPNLLQIPVMIARLRLSAFSNTVDFPVNGWSSLKPYDTVILRGFQAMEKNVAGLNVTRVRSTRTALEMLDMDRTQVAVLPYLDGLVYRNQLSLHKIRALHPPLEAVPLYHYLHEKHLDLKHGITKVLESMEQNGEIQLFWDTIEKDLLRN